MKFLSAIACALLATMASADTTGLKCFIPMDEDGEQAHKLCLNSTSGEMTLVELEEPVEASTIETDVDVLWVVICGALVFFMQAGFLSWKPDASRRRTSSTSCSRM